MQPTRLTLGVLMACALACTKNIELPPVGMDSAPGAGGSFSGSGGRGGAPPPTDAGDAFDRSSEIGDSGPTDQGAVEVSVVHGEAGPPRTTCAGDMATLGSRQLVAGGATPQAFAAAYNAELSSINSPGPFLLALTGVNQTLPSGWTALLGALGRTAQGAVSFVGPRAAVPFSMSDTRAIEIPSAGASFDLAFPAPSAALLPVVSVRLSGTLAKVCSSLAVTALTLLVPGSAGGAAFHGSTVADLMGPLTEAWGGSPAGAWPLQLSGLAQQVDAVGIIDAGAEP